MVLSVIHPSGFCCLQDKVETPLLSSHVTTPLTSSCCRKASWDCLPYTCAKSFSFRCVCVCVNLWQHWSSDALTLTLSPCLKIVKLKEKKGKKGRKKKKTERKSRGQTLGQTLFSLVQRIRRISRRLQVKPDNVSGQRNIYRWHTHYSLSLFLAFFPPFSFCETENLKRFSFPREDFVLKCSGIIVVALLQACFIFKQFPLCDALRYAPLSEKADKQTNCLTGERQEIFRMIASQSHMFSSLFLSLSLMSVFLSSSAD